MTAYDENLIRAIDSRIESARRRTTAWGTLTSRDTTGPGATFTFDGSSVAVAAKVLGNAHAIAGDRVAVAMVDDRWVILGSTTRRQFGEASYISTLPAGTTTSASYVDMPGSPSLELAKRYDLTAVRIAISTSAYASTQPVVWYVALRIAGAPNTVTATEFTALDVRLSVGTMNVANSHTPIMGMGRMDTLMAGDYVMTARWLRFTGSGTLTTDAFDPIMIEADEIYRTTSS